MGAGQSTSHSHAPPRALHVLRVTPSSPASQTSIEPYFDFVVGFEGDSLPSHEGIEVSELERIVESHEGRNLNLLVWNSKSQETRVVPIVPSRLWSQTQSEVPTSSEPSTNPQPSLLGLSMRMCEPEFALDNVWHVLDVMEGSPAESAGLVPFGDWIVGWSGGILSAEGDFYDLVEAHVDKPLRVYVYSHDFDTLREVVLVPNRHWGGEGLLGCVFGFGLLHRIPPQPTDRIPGSTPPELQEPTEEYEEQALFVPADVQPETIVPVDHWEQGRWAPHENQPSTLSRDRYVTEEDPNTLYTQNQTYYDESPTPRQTHVQASTPTAPTRFPIGGGTLMNGNGSQLHFPTYPKRIPSLPIPSPTTVLGSSTLRHNSNNSGRPSHGNGESSDADTDATTDAENDTASRSSLASIE